MKVKCDDCTSEFSQKKSLYAHARKFHKKDLVLRKEKKKKPIPSAKCEECGTEFLYKKHFYAHMRKSHNRELLSKKNPVVKCDECGIGFSQKKHLYAHARKFHKKNLFSFKKNPDFECRVCNKIFSLKSTLRNHEIKIHKSHASRKTSRLLCPQRSCFTTFLNYENLRRHLTTHNIEVEKEEHQFTNLEDFKMWKDNIQQEEKSFYTLDSAPKKLSTVEAWNFFYNCRRSYFYIPQGRNIRSFMGSHKIGKACPSRIKVTMIGSLSQPSLIKVEYWKTHFGHELELGHVSLDSKTRAEIAEKLKEGASFNDILDTVRDNVVNKEDTNQMLSILERKGLHNIVRDFNKNYCTNQHENGADNVRSWVSEMQKFEDNPVLYYKGQYEEDKVTSLNDSDFALIIMTVFQADQFIKLAKNKICIDSIRGTNAYDINLYTIMTVDEFGTGCLVAYCFSNRSDEYIFALFFNKIKSKVGVINPTIFMSDDAPAIYNAWASVVGKAGHKLLCSWHVDRNWRSNLSKIYGEVDKKALVYKTLKVLQQMTNVDEFQSKLIQVQKQLDNDNGTKSFGDYFRTHYANRSESWADCYRKELGINTNMYLESYHKILKQIYLEGRKIKRLDKTIQAVLKVARDSLFKRLIHIKKNKRNQKIQQINARHKSSQALSRDLIKTVEKDKQWLVTSSSSTSVQYHVSFVQETCSHSCLACSACNICIHTFRCSCNDNVINLNICKHIHACARDYFESNRSNNSQDFKETNEVSMLPSMSRNTFAKVSTNETLIKKFELIVDLLNKVNDVSPKNVCILDRYADNCISLLNNQDVVLLNGTDNVNVQLLPSAFEETDDDNSTEIIYIHTDFDSI